MKKSFTLAEVLITLTIIGVIAAVTIPTLYAKYEKEQTVVGLKKAYAEISNAIKMSVAENGPMSDWPAMDEEALNKYILPYFKTVKTVYMREAKEKVGGAYNTISGVPESNGLIMKNDGSSVITLVSGAQVWVQYSVSDSPKSYSLWVDLNGYKKPNTIGKDVFAFTVWSANNNVTLMSRCDTDTEYIARTVEDLTSKSRVCSTDLKYGCYRGGRGWWCGALIQAQGWQITDDYPW